MEQSSTSNNILSLDGKAEQLYWGVSPKNVPQDPPPTFEDKSKVNTCTACKQDFSMFSSKIHCNGCGKVFCKKDCDRWLLLPESFKYHPFNPVHVCQTCYERYSLVDYSRDCDEFGPKDAPSVIVLPGALNPRIVPKCFMDGVKGYHVIAADLPGFGARQHEQLTTESAIESVKEAILKHAREKKALVLGFSMGGHLAMKFADKYPELCTGLILGACINEYWGFRSDMFFKSSKFVYDILPNSLNSQLFLKVCPKDINLMDSRWILAQGMQYHLWGPCGQIMAEPHEHYYRKVLASLKMPIIFIHGSKDYRTGEKAFMQVAPTAELCVIEGADHFAVLIPKYEIQITQKIKEFTDKVCGRSST